MYEFFFRICELFLVKFCFLGYRVLVCGYFVVEKFVEVEKMLLEWKLIGYLLLVDDYKVFLLGYGKFEMLFDMERIINDL